MIQSRRWTLSYCGALVLCCLLLTACQPVLMAPDSTLSEGEAEEIDEIAADVAESVASVMERAQVPGVAVGIVRDGELIYAGGFGVMDVDTDAKVTPTSVFLLSSIAKTVTSVAIMQLVEAGKVDLAAPVVDYLPYFQTADGLGGEITVRNLLMHSSGLPDTDWESGETYTDPRTDDAALEDQVRGLVDVTLLHSPGAQFTYSGYGYETLGAIVAAVSGQTYEDYVTENVFAPLGMANTTMFFPAVDPGMLAKPHVKDEAGVSVSDVFPYTRFYAPDSALFSTVEDMATYAIAHLNQGEAGRDVLMSPDSYELAWTANIDTPFPPPENTYGFGWQIGEYDGQRVVGHAGIDIGYNSLISLFPDLNAAVIIMTNHSDLEEFVLPAFMLRKPLYDVLLTHSERSNAASGSDATSD